jgi:hypothetical protein
MSRSRATAQAKNVTFELHTLGWESFQNLCGHIAREVLGQTVTAFSPGNDAGQDGAFQGKWLRRGKEAFKGRFVLQCKFTARRDAHLTHRDLGDEITKATKLAHRGLARTYVLITNAKISGESDSVIRRRFLGIKGIEFFDILGVEWITMQILTSKRLRAFVPRIYGLGDLSEIIDERVYDQAAEILQSWRDNLVKFVPTDAHRRSVDALIEHGFVLLLGDPMAGKSSIAAALALAAADQWECRPIFVRHPDDIQVHWNPNEPRQMFWVDDAFGQIQTDLRLVDGWNGVFPHLTAAIRKGARVLFTSRTYVYRGALSCLKQTAFPLLTNSQVVIEVERLSLIEKERILYNHLRLGTQPTRFRTQIKPYLSTIAANPKFFPEIAKRLGDPFFTKGLLIAPEPLRQFVEEPKEFLGDVIRQLGPSNFAALALLFMRAGRIEIPPRLDEHEAEAMQILGATLRDLCNAFVSLEGSLVIQMLEHGVRSWGFRHPTIRDAMAVYVAERPELIDVYLRGAKTQELVAEVVCGDVDVEGAKVHVPGNRFLLVIAKLSLLEFSDRTTIRYTIVPFLAYRCSDEFLALWARECEQQFRAVLAGVLATSHPYALLLSRLHLLGLVPNDIRAKYVLAAAEAAVDDADTTFVESDLRSLFRDEEYAAILTRVQNELAPNAGAKAEDLADTYDDPEYDPDDYFSELRSGFETFAEMFTDDETVWGFQDGLDAIDSAIKRIKRRNEELEAEREAEEFEFHRYLHEGPSHPSPPQSAAGTSIIPKPLARELNVDPNERSVFDDVDT